MRPTLSVPLAASIALSLPACAALAQQQEESPAQHRHHPLQDMPLHEKFYSTWFMPDQPTKSCCNKADCYPTEITYRDGVLYAQRREDKKWLRIPPAKVERHRDNPDGRNHLCAPPPNTLQGDVVFCFALGAGA
jgi:hypothetical protein